MAARRLTTVSKILIYQFVIITIAVFGFAVVEGWQAAFCSLLGGATAFLPNIFFGWQVSRTASNSARKAVNAFYFGEVGKWLLTILLFVLVFNLPNIEIFPLLATYMSAISVFWFALLMR